MTVREVPRQEWNAFFDQFSRIHANEPVDVEVRGDQGEGTIARDMPLQGITAGADPGTKTIEIIVGQPKNEDLVSHTIATPVHVRIDESADQDNLIEIEDRDGVTTCVRL